MSERNPRNPYKLAHFKPGALQDLDELFRSESRGERAARWKRIAVGTVVFASAALAVVWARQYFSDESSSAGFYESDSRWGTKWEGVPKFIPFATDGFGGIGEVEIRKLVDESPDDVVGITKPGCLVQGTKSYGPLYRIDGGDADKLPKVGIYNGATKKTGEYMPW